MKRIIRKWLWVWQQDQERLLLERQSEEGYQLVEVGLGKYVFESTEPRKMIYQMDFKGLGNRISEEDYLQLYADAGWHLAAKFGGWYYFCQTWQEGVDLSLFNDNESQSKIYKRMIAFLLLSGLPLYYLTVFLFFITELSGFFLIFKVFILVLALFHASAIIKLLRVYRKLRTNMRE